MIELETNIAAADAKLKVLESYESSDQLQSTSDFVSQMLKDWDDGILIAIPVNLLWHQSHPLLNSLE